MHLETLRSGRDGIPLLLGEEGGLLLLKPHFLFFQLPVLLLDSLLLQELDLGIDFGNGIGDGRVKRRHDLRWDRRCTGRRRYRVHLILDPQIRPRGGARRLGATHMRVYGFMCRLGMHHGSTS